MYTYVCIYIYIYIYTYVYIYIYIYIAEPSTGATISARAAGFVCSVMSR